nr:MAG TPA: hypothetical protein [Caudoviricetes sp.]
MRTSLQSKKITAPETSQTGAAQNKIKKGFA